MVFLVSQAPSTSVETVVTKAAVAVVAGGAVAVAATTAAVVAVRVTSLC
jgi:hypothetical protein